MWWKRAIVEEIAAENSDIVHHEWEDAGENARDTPHAAPLLWMKVGHWEAQLHIGLEAATGSDHIDTGRLVRILRREFDLAVVETTCIHRDNQTLYILLWNKIVTQTEHCKNEKQIVN